MWPLFLSAMARPVRVEYEDAVYHVTARGNERRAVFRCDVDREVFLTTVGQACGRFGTVIHAYCLMPNHYHLIVQTPRANLSRAVGWLQTTYTIRFNRRHRRTGHLVQGRFKAHLVEADSYAQSLVQYIHLNPVRPRDKRGVVPSERRGALDRYRWSSHRAYAGRCRAPEWLSLDWLGYWGRTMRVARRAYARSMAGAFGVRVRSPFEDLRGGLVLGGEGLWEKVRGLLDDRQGHEEIRWRTRADEQMVRRQVVDMVDRETDARVRIWMRVQLGGERSADLARELGYADGSGILRVIQRLESRARQDADLAARLEATRRRVEMSSVKS
ncbi:MAG: transposase [Phycisphaerae bacterium]|nr:transposase [Phycisphaerae bacterium]